MPQSPLDSSLERADVYAANLEAAVDEQRGLLRRLRDGLQLKSTGGPAEFYVVREHLVAATIRTDTLLKNFRADCELLDQLRLTLRELRRNFGGTTIQDRIGGRTPRDDRKRSHSSEAVRS